MIRDIPAREDTAREFLRKNYSNLMSKEEFKSN